MCGICGIHTRSTVTPDDERVVRDMMSLLDHRGPDGDGIWSSQTGAVLGHRRLAIIDLLGGHQPLFNENRDVGVVLNGEIYNYRELRRELTSFGHTFVTASDTEAIVHAYEQWGDSFVERLQGMFAFVIWDERQRRMILGRDRFGVKPLYYAEPDRDHLLFASEIKALFAHPGVSRSLNSARLAEYLMFRSIVGEETLFTGIKEVLPGTLMTLQDGRRNVWRYWSPVARSNREEAATASVERGRELLDDSVLSRLVSDVALGTITSGGLDSSLVSAIAAEHTDHSIDTFCVGFRAPATDERPFARLVSQQIGSRHHDIEVAPTEIERELDSLTWAHDEPLTHPNSVPMHLIFREAKERADVTVLLSGEGADEVFGGYEWYRVGQQRDDLKRRIPGASRLATVTPAFGKLGTFKKVLNRDYLLTANAFSPRSLVESLCPGLEPLSEARRNCWPANAGDSVDGLFPYDQQTYLSPLLQRQDRMSMAAGLEAREPFLDHRLVEWANNLSGDEKLAGGVRKALLKSIARKWLPSEIVDRRKVGFEMPLGDYLRTGGALAHRVEALRDSSSFATQVTQRTIVERLIAEHNSNSHNHGDILWTLIALDSWARTFLGSRVHTQKLPGAATGKSLELIGDRR
jgi:asparagine synthase (glutamine-hydrolysing)